MAMLRVTYLNRAPRSHSSFPHQNSAGNCEMTDSMNKRFFIPVLTEAQPTSPSTTKTCDRGAKKGRRIRRDGFPGRRVGVASARCQRPQAAGNEAQAGRARSNRRPIKVHRPWGSYHRSTMAIVTRSSVSSSSRTAASRSITIVPSIGSWYGARLTVNEFVKTVHEDQIDLYPDRRRAPVGKSRRDSAGADRVQTGSYLGEDTSSA